MTADLKIYPTREAWLAARRESLGGSDAPVAIGVSPYRSPFALWADKMGAPVESSPEAEKRMRMGLRMEPVILAAYADETGHELLMPAPFSLYRSPLGPLHASPDAFVMDPARGLGTVQVKNVSGFAADEWESGDAPVGYLVQVQHEMFVTGAEWADLVALIGGSDLRIVPVERDDKFIARLVASEVQWWADHVVGNVAPPSDSTESTRRALAALYPKEEDGPAIALLSDEWTKLDAMRQRAIDAEKEAKRLKTESENAIKSAMGVAAYAELPGGVSYTWKTVERQAHWVDRVEYRELRRHAPKKGRTTTG